MSMYNTIAVIGAMDSEVEHLTAALSSPELKKIGNLVFHIGKSAEKTVIIVKSGVGKVNAARCTQLLIDRFSPDCIINSGIAGAVEPTLTVGDVIISSDLVQHDFDVTAFGYAKGNLCDGDCREKPTAFPADSALTAQLLRCANALFPERTVLNARIASGDRFVADAAQRAQIYSAFHAAVVEMEGAAVAQTAQYGGVPFAVLRVVSDHADGSAAESCDDFEIRTAMESAQLINATIREL